MNERECGDEGVRELGEERQGKGQRERERERVVGDVARYGG